MLRLQKTSEKTTATQILQLPSLIELQQPCFLHAALSPSLCLFC